MISRSWNMQARGSSTLSSRDSVTLVKSRAFCQSIDHVRNARAELTVGAETGWSDVVTCIFHRPTTLSNAFSKAGTEDSWSATIIDRCPSTTPRWNENCFRSCSSEYSVWSALGHVTHDSNV